MFKLMDKKIIAILRNFFSLCLTGPMVYCSSNYIWEYCSGSLFCDIILSTIFSLTIISLKRKDRSRSDCSSRSSLIWVHTVSTILMFTNKQTYSDVVILLALEGVNQTFCVCTGGKMIQLLSN